MVVKNIFLADDDFDDVELFNEALKGVCNTCTLTSSKNGIELLDKLTASQKALPQVLFLDINMPLMNGLECLEKIKSEDTFKNIPVVILTTSTSASTIERAYKLGANLFIEKPSDYLKLQQLLRDIIKMDLSRLLPSSLANFVYKPARV